MLRLSSGALLIDYETMSTTSQSREDFTIMADDKRSSMGAA
jgi:hypothetical protein